jgi:hypothetical protein
MSKRLMIIGAITFENEAEEKVNLEDIEEIRSCFYEFDEEYEIFDLKALLEEVNSMSGRFKIPNTPLKISETSWISFSCLNYVLSHLAYCDYVFFLESALECPVASQVLLVSRIMGINCFFFEEKRYGVRMLEQENKEIRLPYVNYDDFIKNTEALKDEDFLSTELTDNNQPETLPNSGGFGNWFNSQFGKQ